MSPRTVGDDNETLPPDFLDFITCLNERQVDFVLIGGYAVGVHGFVRATGDIDFFYRRTEANVKRLCAALKAFGAPPMVIVAADLMKPQMVTQFGNPPLRIDLLNTIDGVSFARVWNGALKMEIQGQTMLVIGLAELRANKAATHRKKDADDLRKLDVRKPRAKRPGRKRAD